MHVILFYFLARRNSTIFFFSTNFNLDFKLFCESQCVLLSSLRTPRLFFVALGLVFITLIFYGKLKLEQSGVNSRTVAQA